MSKWEKLLTRLQSLDAGLRFEELRKILEYYGYVMCSPRSGSSHCTFRKEGCNPITIPVHKPIKKVYIQLVKQVVESEEDHGEND